MNRVLKNQLSTPTTLAKLYLIIPKEIYSPNLQLLLGRIKNGNTLRNTSRCFYRQS